MTWILATWISWQCPGGWLSGLVPAQLRPFVCQISAEVERFDPAQLERARGRIREQGPSSKLYRCDARRCREIKVSWQTVTHFDE